MLLFLPSQPNLSPGIVGGIVAFYVFFALVFAGLGAWWLVYFTRPAIKPQFLSAAIPAAVPRGPLSIKIIAWLMVVACAVTSFSILSPYPMMVFGFVLRGWASRALLLLFLACGLAGGIGMLRWRTWAHSLAVGFYGFGLLNVLSFVIPGAVPRMKDAMQEFMPPNAPFDPTVFVWFGLVIGLLTSGVLLWFLLTRRRVFLDACNAPAGAGTHLDERGLGEI